MPESRCVSESLVLHIRQWFQFFIPCFHLTVNTHQRTQSEASDFIFVDISVITLRCVTKTC